MVSRTAPHRRPGGRGSALRVAAASAICCGLSAGLRAFLLPPEAPRPDGAPAALRRQPSTPRPDGAPATLRRRAVGAAALTWFAPSAAFSEEGAAATAAPDIAALQAASDPLEPIVFPGWFAGDWACAAELFNVNAGPGENVMASAIPGAQDALLAAQAAVGTQLAVRRERRKWRPGPRGMVEVPAKLPASTAAAALAMAGRNASMALVGTDAGLTATWDVRAPRGWEWELKLDKSLGRDDPERKGNFRVSEFFTAKSVIGLDGRIGSTPAVKVATVYRQVPAEDSPTGAAFKIGLGEVDTSRTIIIQAIQTVTVLPPPPSPGQNRSSIPLATFKTRLLFSPILAEGAGRGLAY